MYGLKNIDIRIKDQKIEFYNEYYKQKAFFNIKGIIQISNLTPKN